MAGAVEVVGKHLGPLSLGGQTVAYTGTAGLTSAISGEVVDVLCTTDAYVTIGDGVTATTSGYYVPAGVTYRFPITQGHTVSAVQVSSGGNLHVHAVSSPIP